jgi:hypothetical protein
MSHYAQIDENNRVQQVIVVNDEQIAAGEFGDPAQWIKTSYNTTAGEHVLGGTPLRKNFAGIGYIYDPDRDAFYEPQPYPSWILNEDTCQWEAPEAWPAPHGFYFWNESTLSWDLDVAGYRARYGRDPEA